MKETYEEKYINSSMIQSDPVYQREISEPRVRRIIKEFDPRLVNPPKVSFRDGKYYVFDGQHTIAALVAMNGGKSTAIRCHVFYGLTQLDEAALFIAQTKLTARVSTIDTFRALYKIGDPEVCEMVRLAQSAGVIVDFKKGQTKHHVVAVKALFKAYQLLTADQFVKMLTVIDQAWDGDPVSFCAEILGGASVFFNTYNGRFKPTELRNKLKKVYPWEIVREGKASNSHGNNGAIFARVILRHYNKNRTTNYLEDVL